MACTGKAIAGLTVIMIAIVATPAAAQVLDAAYRVQVRAGLHCAPLMHQSLGTLAAGGTVRMSLGPFSDEQHVDAAIRAVSEVAVSAHG